MTLRLGSISSDLIGLSPHTPVRAKLPSGDIVEVELEVLGLDTNDEVQVILHIPTIGADMTAKAPTTTRPEGGENPDTTSAAGPALDPKTGISPPEAIPEDQGTYQDQNTEYTEEEAAQEAANLTGNEVDGKKSENSIEATQTSEGSSTPDAPKTPEGTPTEPPAPDDFADLDKPAA